MAEIVPFEPGIPEQELDLQLGGYPCILRVRWNTRASVWCVDVYESDRTPIVLGLCLVLGVVLGRWVGHPLFAGAFVVLDDGTSSADPDFADLGTRCRLIYLTRSDRLLAGAENFVEPETTS